MKTYGTKNAACSSKFSLTGEEHYATAQRIALRNRYPRLWRRCGWGTRDPVTIQLFFTAFSLTPNPILYRKRHAQRFEPDFQRHLDHCSHKRHRRDPAPAGQQPGDRRQGGGVATGHIFDITNTGTSVATVTTPSNGTNITADGGAGVTNTDVRGLIFDPHNSTWYYRTAADVSTSGTLGTATLNGTQAASAAARRSGARSHLRPNDKRHRLQQR